MVKEGPGHIMYQNLSSSVFIPSSVLISAKLKSNEMEKPMTNKLFQTKSDVPEYGTFLAKNSQGNYVLEMKGSGEVKSFSPDEIEEVRPYTVKLSSSRGMSLYHVAVKKGSLEVGDLVVYNDQVCVVDELDTKVEAVTNQYPLYKLNATKVE